MTIKAVWENGVFKPTEPVRLKEKTEVQVLIPSDAAVGDEDPTGWKAVEDFIGFLDEGPEGESIAAEHDRYLYGDRRR